MNTNDLLRHFGDKESAMAAVDAYRQLWDIWAANGIPRGRQFEIQIITGGALRADPKIVRRKTA